LSGVYPKAREALYEAYPGLPETQSGAARNEASRDRVMITLLALNFLLMAFFAVMTSIADEKRTTIVAPAGASQAPGTSLSTDLSADLSAEALAKAEASAKADTMSQARMLDEERRRAVDQLRASVALVFAPVMAAEDTWRTRATWNVGNDRVDIEVPFALFANPDRVAEGDEILAGIADVVDTGVRGYRAELALRASHPETDIALLAQRLTTHGLAPSALSVGILKPVGGQANGEALLRFSFFLLEDTDDVIVRLARAPRPIRRSPEGAGG
jgi:hypothetical protein